MFGIAWFIMISLANVRYGRYEVALTPPEDGDLAERIRGDLDLLKKKAAGAPSMGVLESRLERDLERIRQALKAYGYYDGVAEGAISAGTPARVTIVVRQGPLYRIGVFRIVWQGAAPSAAPETVVEGLPAGLPIAASEVADELARRRLGYGGGPRMRFEQDVVTLVGGGCLAIAADGSITATSGPAMPRIASARNA